jgi:nitrite reductase (NADH) large subunit
MKRTSVETVKRSKIVLIGNGPVGFKFCEKFLKYRLGKQFDLVVYGEEKYPAYDRINLTKYFSDPAAEKLYLAPADWYEKNKIALKTGEKVVEINREDQWIKTQSGKVETYDRLILATGSSAYVPPLENMQLKGVFVYRTIEDLSSILDHFKSGQKAVVIGAGILGLEAARALLNAGMETTVVEVAQQIMPRQLDAAGAGILQHLIEELGLKLLTSKRAKTLRGNEYVEGIEFADGTSIDADLVIISAGIRARDELARSCGLETGSTGGIDVNNYNLTADENIFAIGECAFAAGKTWGLAAPCFEMADVVASRLAKIYKVFSGNVLLTKLKLLETKVISFGDALGENPHIPLIYTDPENRIYKRVNISPDEKYILGGILVGEAGTYSTLFHMLRNRIKISGSPADLVNPDLERGEEKIIDLPDDMIICLCEGITKGTIVSEIRENNITRLDEVKALTNAGSGCESCTSLLEEILTELTKESLGSAE